MTFSYTAVEVKQQPNASSFYLLSVKASELLEWADVPKKKPGLMAGYQRVLSLRHEDVKKFIELDPKNIIPNAVIIAVRDEDVKIVKQENGAVKLSIDTPEQSFENHLNRIYQSFYKRLNEDEKASVDSGIMINNERVEQEIEDEIEDESQTPPSYLSQITLELKQATNDFGSLPIERQKAIREYVDGVSKPGLILDGQHRVFGAKNVSKFDVYLPVVLLPGIGEGEQAFHFYVLNNKAKPLRPTELRATISTSLSNQEINELFERFNQANVNADEARWTHKVNVNSESPFFGLVDFGYGGQGFIDENVAHQLVKGFVKMPRQSYGLLFESVDEWMQDPNYDYRLKLFYAFWRGIKERYNSLWNQVILDVESGKKSQFFYKVSLLTLQRFTLNKLSELMAVRNSTPFEDPQELEDLVAKVLGFLPEDFFTRPWMIKSLDHAEGRAELFDTMDRVYKTRGKNMGSLKLFKSRIDA